VEEITQKAGNYKKFPVFVRMLSSAMSRESDSVFVDLLTYGDLEVLKARKTGAGAGAGGGQSAPPPPRSQSKRYMILTYSGEFDRVHFPLPLQFEEEPDVPALQRAVARLKRAVLEQTTAQLDQSQSGREDSASQLRRENNELRHRLRNLEGRTLPSGAPASSVAASQQNGEVLLAYSKLKRQYDTTRKELQAATLAYERLRTDSAKEITKLKIQLVGDSNPKSQSMDNIELSKKLRSQCIALKRDLDVERTEHKRCIARHQRELANLRHASSTYPGARRSASPGGGGTPAPGLGRRPSPSPSALPPRPVSGGSSRRGGGGAPSLSASASSRRGEPSSYLRRSSSPLYGGGGGGGSSGRGGRSTTPPVSTRDSSHHSPVSSRYAQTNQRGGAHDRYSRGRAESRSPSPGVERERPPWNAGSRKKNSGAGGYESGYSSAASHSSAGSRRSRTSQGSRGSQGSGRSGGEKTGGAGGRRSKKKAVPRSPLSEADSEGPYYSNEDSAVRKRKPTKKSKGDKKGKGDKDKDKDKKISSHGSPLDIDIFATAADTNPDTSTRPPHLGPRGSAEPRQSLSLREPAAAAAGTPPRERGSVSRRSHDRVSASAEQGQGREQGRERERESRSSRDGKLRTSADSGGGGGGGGGAMVAVRRSDDSRTSQSQSRRSQEGRQERGEERGERREDRGEGQGSSIDIGVLGTHLASTRRLDPNAFPISRAVDPAGGGDEDEEEEEAMRHAFDGLRMVKRARAEAAAESDLPSMRHSRESGNSNSNSERVVITRAGPPRGEPRGERGDRDRDRDRDRHDTASRRPTQREASSDSSEGEEGGAGGGGGGGGGDNDISEIDKRIKALQSFLDKARSGIIGEEEEGEEGPTQ
jgi:coiled-coil domain-containing protein 61